MLPYAKREPGLYHLDEPTDDERHGRECEYKVVIRHLLRPDEFVFRFAVLGKDLRLALKALNDRDTLLRVLLADDDDELEDSEREVAA